MAARCGCDAKRLDVLSFEHGQPAAPRVKVAAVVGRIQLAAEPHVPAVGVAEPRHTMNDAFENAHVGLAAQLGYRELVAGERGEQSLASA